jgi:hypothetical protein
MQTMNQTFGEIKGFLNLRHPNELGLTSGNPLVGKCLQMVTARSQAVCPPSHVFTKGNPIHLFELQSCHHSNSGFSCHGT